MRNAKKWLVGLAVLALLFVSVTALANAPKPKRLETGKAISRDAANGLRALAAQTTTNPKVAAMAAARKGHHNPKIPKPTVQPEAYAATGAFWAEGFANKVVTNGKVTVWQNDTDYGNITFAPANDLAHPTAYAVGEQGFGPQYNWFWGVGYPCGIGNNMLFDGDMLYYNLGYAIDVFDCSDPTNIAFANEYDLSCYGVVSANSPIGLDWCFDFKVKNGYLYAAMGYSGFLIYSLGNPSFPVLYGNSVHAAENPDLGWFNGAAFVPFRLEVTDDTLILFDPRQGVGGVCLWDITNMLDPLHTTHLYPGGFNGNPFWDLATLGTTWLETGMDAFGHTIPVDIQFKYVSGWLFVANSFGANIADTGVIRIDWQEESNPDSIFALAEEFEINTGIAPIWGAPRNITDFAIVGTGSFVFVSYLDVYDGLTDIVGDSGEKWDWSNWTFPTSLITYKMDRFFFNNYANYPPPPYIPLTANAMYGGFSISFWAPTPGEFRAVIAGWNYVGEFNDGGSLTQHYVVGADPELWPVASWTPLEPWYQMPAGSSVFNFIRLPNDAYTLEWYPEGIAVIDNATALRAGFWECPNRADFVRNVAVTSDSHYAFVACGSLGLITLDLTDPTNPVTVGHWWTNPTAPTLFKQPVTYVYVSSDPALPDIARFAYIQTRVIAPDALNLHPDVNVLRVLDISDPPLPAEVNAYEMAVGTWGIPNFEPAPPGVAAVYWDINHIELADAYAYNGHRYLQISNGEGRPWGPAGAPWIPAFEPWNPMYSNSIAWYNYDWTGGSVGSFVIGDVTTPSAVANRYDASWGAWLMPTLTTLTPSTYCFMSAFYVPTNPANYWAYLADGFLEVVDMGDPAAGVTHTHHMNLPATSMFPDPYGWGTVDAWLPNPSHPTPFPDIYTKVWRVHGFDQIATGYFFLGEPGYTGGGTPWTFDNTWSFDQWDATLPLMPQYLGDFFLATWPTPAFGGTSSMLYRFGYTNFFQLGDDTWMANSFYNSLLYWSNKADYIPPQFTTAGPDDDGWFGPYCSSFSCGNMTGPMDLKVQVIDNVGVTSVRFVAAFVNTLVGPISNWDGCLDSANLGLIYLGSGTGPDSDNIWTFTVDPSMFDWTGWVMFGAQARDAGGNRQPNHYGNDMILGGTAGAYWNGHGVGGHVWYVAASPAISVEVGPAGTDYPYVFSTTTVAAKVTLVRDDPHVVRVLFKVDGLSIGDGTYNSTTDRWYTNWKTDQLNANGTRAFPDCNHTIIAEVTTGGSAVAVSDPVHKYVANDGPDSHIITPVAGAYVYGPTDITCEEITLCAGAEVDPVPIDHVEIFLDRPSGALSGGIDLGPATQASAGAPYTLNFDFSTIADGNHTLVSEFYDIRWDHSMRHKGSSWVSFSKITYVPMAGTISANPTAPTDAQTVTFTAAVTGGLAPFVYNWSSTPAGLSGTGSTASYRFPAGSYVINCSVTDGTGAALALTSNLTVTNSIIISNVVKAQNPFRLKITGSGFLGGCHVNIGTTTVTTAYKNGGLVVAKKCKSLCPKGTPVMVYVVNPDGTSSVGTPFTR